MRLRFSMSFGGVEGELKQLELPWMPDKVEPEAKPVVKRIRRNVAAMVQLLLPNLFTESIK
jgi:hypothetical protein